MSDGAVSVQGRRVKPPAGGGLARLAELLRELRRRAELSQLELALRLGVSQRHVGFVEVARARPSRDLLLAWFDTLDAPVSICNAALIHAGYPLIRHAVQPIEPDDPRHAALEGLVRGHEPCPAVVFDADWFAVSMTVGGRELCRRLMPDLPAAIGDGPRGLDMIASIGHPDGLLSRAENPERVAAALLNQFEIEAWARPELRERTRRCAADLQARYDLPPRGAQDIVAPHLQHTFRLGDNRLSFFTVQAVLGLPQNVNSEALRAELWFPEDDGTRRFMAEFSTWEAAA